jgi:FkbM family methyltransferase
MFALGLGHKEQKDLSKLLNTASYFLQKGIAPESQLLQDLWVISQHGDNPGFFLDIGAGHPIHISNSWTLQSQFDWEGIIFEPNPEFSLLQKQIRSAPGVEILKLAVTPTKQDFMNYKSDGEYSGDPDNFPGELHSERNKSRKKILTERVPATTLREVLETRGITKVDYISLDIEGGELDILKSFPFDVCSVHLITVEHNFRRDDMLKIDKFLEEKNFRRSLNSETEWDSFYVNNEWKI